MVRHDHRSVANRLRTWSAPSSLNRVTPVFRHPLARCPSGLWAGIDGVDMVQYGKHQDVAFARTLLNRPSRASRGTHPVEPGLPEYPAANTPRPAASNHGFAAF